MPTFDRSRAFVREWRKLSPELRRAFERAVSERFVPALSAGRPFPTGLRVKRVEGSDGVFEMSFGDGGRATFKYGPEVRQGQAHVIWRRIGDHSIFSRP